MTGGWRAVALLLALGACRANTVDAGVHDAHDGAVPADPVSGDGAHADGTADRDLPADGPAGDVAGDASSGDAVSGDPGPGDSAPVGCMPACTGGRVQCDPVLHTCGANDAAFVSQTVPSSMTPGQPYAVAVTMRNTGTLTWSETTFHRLGSQHWQDNTTWAIGRVAIPAGTVVYPGDSHTFAFNVTAPAVAGHYDFQWRMVQDGVEWFGESSANLVPGMGLSVCEAARAFADTATNAAPTIQACIDATPAGGRLELPAGVYTIASQLHLGTVPMTLTSEGKALTDPTCAFPAAHDCAELKADAGLYAANGLLSASGDGVVLDHLVVNGNKAVRAGSLAYQTCNGGNNAYGYNLVVSCNYCGFTKNVTHDALCATGVFVAGTDVTVTDNIVARNGVHNVQGMWADGMTVGDAVASTFLRNELWDNTDVDLIFGGCAGCLIRDNTVAHGADFAQSSFAAMMIHAWPSSSGDYTGADIANNTIDCGSSRRCGFGLLVGSDAWYTTWSFGGAVHGNRVANAQQGFTIDDAHDMAIYDNPVTNPATSTAASCGTRTTGAYHKGSRSYAIDTSADTLGTTYASVDWDGCIPNWWH